MANFGPFLSYFDGILRVFLSFWTLGLSIRRVISSVSAWRCLDLMPAAPPRGGGAGLLFPSISLILCQKWTILVNFGIFPVFSWILEVETAREPWLAGCLILCSLSCFSLEYGPEAPGPCSKLLRIAPELVYLSPLMSRILHSLDSVVFVY